MTCSGLGVTSSLATTVGPAGGGSSPPSANTPATSATANTATRERRGQLGRRETPAGVPQRPAERGATGLALRRVVQLRLEPGHEVLPHRRGPILSLTAARPRLTRLRTTVSVVFSDAAISP